MLKILFLSNRIPFPVKDGQSRRTYNILKGLAQKNEVHFLSLYEEEADSKIIEHFESFCKYVEVLPSPPKKISIFMVLRILRSLISQDPYTIWRHYSRPFMKRIQELANNRKFDLIHCDILPLAYTLRNIKGIPCTLTDHDVSYLKALRISEQARGLSLKLFLQHESRKLKKFESKIFEQVHVGITVSSLDKAILLDLCPKANVMVIENGVDINHFTPSKTMDQRSLVWVGGFGYAPNREAIHYFLERIYPLIKKEVPEVMLNLIGNGVTEKIKNFSSHDPSIKIFGYVDDPIPHIQRATVFIAPILSGSGTRLKILEAMAAGKAVVSTTVGCEGIEGIEKIHYLTADKPADFAKCVTDILTNPKLRQQLGVNARKLAIQKYDWETIVDKINKTYEDLVGRQDRKEHPRIALTQPKSAAEIPWEQI